MKGAFRKHFGIGELYRRLQSVTCAVILLKGRDGAASRASAARKSITVARDLSALIVPLLRHCPPRCMRNLFGGRWLSSIY